MWNWISPIAFARSGMLHKTEPNQHIDSIRSFLIDCSSKKLHFNGAVLHIQVASGNLFASTKFYANNCCRHMRRATPQDPGSGLIVLWKLVLALEKMKGIKTWEVWSSWAMKAFVTVSVLIDAECESYRWMGSDVWNLKHSFITRIGDESTVLIKT